MGALGAVATARKASSRNWPAASGELAPSHQYVARTCPCRGRAASPIQRGHSGRPIGEDHRSWQRAWLRRRESWSTGAKSRPLRHARAAAAGAGSAPDIQARNGGLDLPVGVDREFPWLELLWVDGAYAASSRVGHRCHIPRTFFSRFEQLLVSQQVSPERLYLADFLSIRLPHLRCTGAPSPLCPGMRTRLSSQRAGAHFAGETRFTGVARSISRRAAVSQ
jgi:hypothetical protein